MIKGRVEGDFNHVYDAMFRLDTMEAYTDSLLIAWTNVLIEDNRRGVMMGIDGDGQRMTPTKYRNSFAQTSPGKATDTFFNARGQQIASDLPIAFSGPRMGSLFSNISGTPGVRGFKGGTGDNLTSAEYRKMSGPPLAPRGAASRVISNYTVEYLAGANMIGVEGGWDSVVSKKGVPFLPFHFNGATSSRATFAKSIGGDNHHLPRRNLVGLRQWGMTQARKELNAWIKWLLTVAQPEYFGQKRAGHAPKYVRNRSGRS